MVVIAYYRSEIIQYFLNLTFLVLKYDLFLRNLSFILMYG